MFEINEREMGISPLARIRKIDWAARDANNRRLGHSGEKFVAELERRHPVKIGRKDLAARVEIVAATQGDGAGYDVLSFSDSGGAKYIEVKTTEGGKQRPFLITANEPLCSFGLPVDTAVPFLAGGPTSQARVSIATLSVSSISRLDQNMFLAPGLDAGYFVWLAADSVNVSFNY
jgi:hypothetical protein